MEDYKLTDKDLEKASGMFFVFAGGAEQAIRLQVDHYFDEFRMRTAYKMLVKKMGKKNADAYVRNQLNKQFKEGKVKYIGDWLDAAHRMKYVSEAVAKEGMRNDVDNGFSDIERYDALMEDYNLMMYVYGLLTNCTESELKDVLEYARNKGTRGVVNEEFLNKCFYSRLTWQDAKPAVESTAQPS